MYPNVRPLLPCCMQTGLVRTWILTRDSPYQHTITAFALMNIFTETMIAIKIIYTQLRTLTQVHAHIEFLNGAHPMTLALQTICVSRKSSKWLLKLQFTSQSNQPFVCDNQWLNITSNKCTLQYTHRENTQNGTFEILYMHVHCQW